MKRTRLDQFKDEVIGTMNRLGIRGGWDVRFIDSPKCPDEARVNACPRTRLAVFTLGRPDAGCEIPRLARHEVAHLLLAELVTLAESRYTSEDAMDRAGETVCTVLERVL